MDPFEVTQKVETGRASDVRLLRTIAEQLETLPLEDAAPFLVWMRPQLDALQRWTERIQPLPRVVRADDASKLPAFSSTGRCPSCGNAESIRVHFDRGPCRWVRSGDHQHRLCRCGYEWVEA